MTTSRCPDHGEHAADLSPSSHLLDQLQLYGHHPFDDEPDPRPLPDPKRLQGALADMFDALVATLSETRLEPDLPDLLWSVANLIHRRIDRIGRALDSNETEQPRSQREQDGSEIRSVQLERLIVEGSCGSNGATASNSSATRPSNSMRCTLARLGGPAAAAR